MPMASPPRMGRMPQLGEALMPTLGRATEGSSWAQPSTVSLGVASLQARGDDFDQEVCRCISCKLDGISNRSQVGRGGDSESRFRGRNKWKRRFLFPNKIIGVQ